MNNRGILSYLAISICVFVSSAFPGAASEGIEGTYEGDGLPQQANPAWMLVCGTPIDALRITSLSTAIVRIQPLSQ